MDPQHADTQRPPRSRTISFHDVLELTTGSRRDWPYFAPWHYRGHGLGVVRFVTLLWHDVRDGGMGRSGVEETKGTHPISRPPDPPIPIGICVFTSPPIALAGRHRYFGLGGRWSRTRLRLLNSQLVMLSRVVLHPTYRGAGLAAPFVRDSCRACGFPWVEALAQMGHVNPFFERAGFTRVDVSRSKSSRTSNRRSHSSIYGGRRGALLSHEAHRKSRYANPVYYVLDNRGASRVHQPKAEGETGREEEVGGLERDAA